MTKLSDEELNKINFDDEDTQCECGAYGVFIPPSEVVKDTIKAKFLCNNGHYFTKVYPHKD